jgi:CHAD domain-containing protein
MSAPPSWIELGRAELGVSLAAAADLFPRAGDDEAERIHEARRELKRAAALARLYAPILGAPAYGALDAVSTARRRVGRARDLDVMPDVLARLECDPETSRILLGVIEAERGKARDELAGIDLARVEGDLREAAAAVAEADLDGDGLEALLRSLRVSYRSGKRCGRAAWASGDAEDLHDLRARVVDLAHQCAVFEPAWPAMFAAMDDEMRKLRQTLGAHNDLTVLGEFALSRRELSPEAAEALVALVLKRRKPLERRAAGQFARVFAERPGAFARRIGGYLGTR